MKGKAFGFHDPNFSAAYMTEEYVRKVNNLPQHVEKKRRCLRCDTEFLSKNFGNRLCGTCINYAKLSNGFPVEHGE